MTLKHYRSQMTFSRILAGTVLLVVIMIAVLITRFDIFVGSRLIHPQSPSPTSVQSNITYQRSGGIAGLDDRLTIDADGHASFTRQAGLRQVGPRQFIVASAVMNRLTTLLNAANFSSHSPEYLPDRSGADLVSYRIAYKGHTVQTMDTAIPRPLEPIINSLNQIISDQANQ